MRLRNDAGWAGDDGHGHETWHACGQPHDGHDDDEYDEYAACFKSVSSEHSGGH